MKYLVSGNAPYNYPVETFFGLLNVSEELSIEIPYAYPLYGEWGTIISNIMEEPEDHPLPKGLDTVYLSIAEQKFYSSEEKIPEDIIKEKWDIVQRGHESDSILYLVVGFAPYGYIALWIRGDNKSVLVSIFKAIPVNVNMADFRSSPNITLNDVCLRYMNNLPHVKNNIQKKGLPPESLFDKYMQQYIYRYIPLYEKYDVDKNEWYKYDDNETIPVFEYIEEVLCDGTHDKLHDGGLLKYHEAGKPKKLAVKWFQHKSEYVAYFWFDDERICSVYDKFYRSHPYTKVDFIIHIDETKHKYELALYRYGLNEPSVISESSYQLIVFKNKFEYYRSKNYDMPQGSWIW